MDGVATPMEGVPCDGATKSDERKRRMWFLRWLCIVQTGKQGRGGDDRPPQIAKLMTRGWMRFANSRGKQCSDATLGLKLPTVLAANKKSVPPR